MSEKTTTRYSPARTRDGMSGGDFVPLDRFGKDHWSVLAYMSHVMTECKGFQCGLDPRMRQGRRNFRVMWEGCISPRRPGPNLSSRAVVMDPKYGSRLADGTVALGHDDWHCVQDLAQAGFFEVSKGSTRCAATSDDVQPGALLHLSAYGRAVMNLLTAHKQGGGNFAGFSDAHHTLLTVVAAGREFYANARRDRTFTVPE